MNRLPFAFTLVSVSLLMLVASVGFCQTGSSAVDQVNVMIGTAAEGQTFPAAGVPFAMTQWTPQTQAGEGKCVAPYYAADTKIQGFRGSHFPSGSCMQDYGSFTMMPMASDAKLGPVERASAFARSSEQSTPYFYGVDLSESGIHAGITGSLHAGMMEFVYRKGQKTGWLAVDDNVRLGLGTLRIDTARQEITGENPVYRLYAGAGEPAGFSGYVVVQFDRPFRVGGMRVGKVRRAGATEAESSVAGAPGAYVSFALGADNAVRVRIGTSFVSVDEARKNLAAEMPDWNFEAATAQARAAWQTELTKVDIEGNSPDRRIFYTAMYHSMLLPRTFSDVSGTYPRFARSMIPDGPMVETAQGWTYYCDYSVWDTFRAVHPMFTILDPARDSDMVKSLIAKGEQGGFLPIFPAWNSYTSEMTGDHAGAIITDAYMKGIRGFNAEAAFQLMKKNAMQAPPTMELYRLGQGRRGLGSYIKYGYIPLEDTIPNAFHGNEQVSRTLDYAYDDFVLSQLARALGHTADADYFAGRGQNYRNVIDQESGFARGRHADGSWVVPFNPTAPASYITESTPYVYTFFVPQDVQGLIGMLGGREEFVKKLDGVFSSGVYDHGNEPSHQIAYMYDDAGVPWKTQIHVHEIMTTLYRDSNDGLAGNDDAGQMSAWYVLSAMGFYPVTPGIPRYAIGTPRFDDMTLHVGSGKILHIRATGAEAGRFYVKSVRLNGTLLDRPWILHSEIVAGGELVFEMSATAGSI
jgi:predicted alpha-1,2-mannosidase